MKIVFMGTPDFAAPTLRALRDAGHEIALVVSQPDRVRGRGNKTTPSPVKALALELGLAVSTPPTLCEPAMVDDLARAAPDAMVVVAYGELLRPQVLCLPRLQCINGHASLLPRYRGAGPIPAAILNGDPVTGVTTMLMEAGLDTGPMLLSREVPIAPDDTCATLSDKLARVTAELMVETLAGIEAGTVTPTAQDDRRASYAPKITKNDGRIAWSITAAEIERRVRAYDPWPGAFFTLHDQPVKIRAARALPTQSSDPAGTVLAADKTGIAVACRQSSLLITQLQPPGKKPMTAADFLSGHRLTPGTRLE